jgi:sodium/bile acid cotransporter 7
MLVDRGSVLLVVYTAFSAGVVHGIWHQAPAVRLVGLAALCVALLGAVLGLTTAIARRAGLARADRIVVIFCGSKKSLASGLPMASVLFPANIVSLIVLPLMMFHLIQLIVCAMLARRWGDQPELRTDDAAEAKVGHGRLDHLGLSGRGPVALAVIRGAEVRSALDDPARDVRPAGL